MCPLYIVSVISTKDNLMLQVACRAARCVSFGRNISGSPSATSVITEYQTGCILITAQVPVFNALVLSNLYEYRHKSYIAKTKFFGYIFVTVFSQTLWVFNDVIDPDSRELPNSVK